jgi:predicted DNA-binding protein (MmcQ/YjbR family)
MHMADAKLIATLSSLLGPLPDVTEEKTETHATFLIKKKVFAFTRSSGPGVALKLPKERITALLQREDITLLAMGKRTMKEWIVVEHPKPADYKKDLALFKEAKAFVEAGKKK